MSAGSEIPGCLNGKRSQAFWSSLSEQDQHIFHTLGEERLAWLGEYLRCTGGPSRTFLIQTCLATPGFRRIVFRVLCFEPFFDGAKMRFPELSSLFDHLKRHEYVDSAIEDEQPVDHGPPTAYKWSERGKTRVEYGRRQPPTAMRARAARIKDEEIADLLAEVVRLMIAVASGEDVDTLKGCLKEVDPTGETFKEAALRLIVLAPTSATLAWISSRNTKLAESIREALKKRPLREDVEKRFDRDVLGFRL